MTITGGCLCGAVHYRIDALPVAKRICCCRDCQFIGGGHGTVNLTFRSEAVHIEGQLAVMSARPIAATSCIGASVRNAERRSRRNRRRGRIS